MDKWTDWPSREALNREGLAPARQRVGAAARYLGLGGAVFGSLASHHPEGVALWLVLAAAVLGVFGLWGFLHTVPAMRMGVSLAWLTLILAQGLIAVVNGVPVLGVIFLCGIAMAGTQRMPLIAAVPMTLLATLLFMLLVPQPESWVANVAIIFGLGVMGYVVRLDWEGRATTQRLLGQERAARVAEAESAALAERARIAREIHDVLAHSLSAQLVHLEAARLMLDAGADRAQLRERIVAARRMAQDGLAETRQALSALRGEFVPVGDFLEAVARNEGAELVVVGEPRPLSAEASVAVRRTAQEAFTNVRKHAPGAPCAIRLSYLDGTVELEVRNSAPPGAVASELAGSGSGLGLRGMRERAELLGGSLVAGPDQDGFLVRLSVPAP
ncbi:sensor histidine kinase [Streptacidiphilus sp. EB129]|uniref:sensor histidine kinase n=1 Tax=Streptacidiphilus sp. EB129 TaxID=3156262 RepID=UPI003514EF41